MKNISRRVFIKGLAVAGVAAAASTVLAGCNTNMIPDTDNGTDEPDVVPTPSNTFTFKDGDKTLVVSSPKIETVTHGIASGKEALYIDVVAENKLAEDVLIKNAQGTATTNPYSVVVSVAAWKADGTVVTTTPKTDAVTGASNLFLTAGQTVSSNNSMENGVIYFDSIDSDWAKLNVTFKVYKAYADSSDANQTYAPSADYEATFTYTNN